jgi:hypothetical protein
MRISPTRIAWPSCAGLPNPPIIRSSAAPLVLRRDPARTAPRSALGTRSRGARHRTASRTDQLWLTGTIAPSGACTVVLGTPLSRRTVPASRSPSGRPTGFASLNLDPATVRQEISAYQDDGADQDRLITGRRRCHSTAFQVDDHSALQPAGASPTTALQRALARPEKRNGIPAVPHACHTEAKPRHARSDSRSALTPVGLGHRRIRQAVICPPKQ